MLSVSAIIYRAAGEPPTLPCPDYGRCRACGCDGSGIRFQDWVRRTFTDHDKLTAGTVICQACLFCFEDKGNQELGRRVGKADPQRMRNYSHFVDGRGEWIPLSKGDKAKMRRLLLAHDTAVAVIADSGQKHLIFRARPGWWQFEECAVMPDRPQLGALLDIMTPMLTVFSKEELRTAQYNQRRMMEFGIEQWTISERGLKPRRGSLIFTLALFLAQKDSTTDDA